MNRAGYQFFARAGAALNQDGSIRLSNPFNNGEDALHRGGFADDLAELIAVAHLRFKLCHARAQGATLQRAFNAHLRIGQLQRLAEVIFGTPPHRFDCRINGAKGGHHNHQGVRVACLDFVKEM